MSNIPYLAAHLEKRAGKEESFDIIKRLINGEKLKDHDLAVLYSYFMPPTPKKITNPFDFLTLICDQNSQYSFCKYVFVENNKVMTANTKIAHVVHDNLDLESGWYDIKKGSIGDDIAIMPDVYEVLDNTNHKFNFNKYDFENGLFDIIETTTGLSYILPWSDKGVDKKYFDIIIKSMDNITIKYTDDKNFNIDGFINSKKCTAIIMPFKINGFSKNNKEEQAEQREQSENIQMEF